MIESLLRRAGISAEHLARLSGVDEAALDDPSVADLRKVATALGMTAAELLRGADPPHGGMYRGWLDEPAQLEELAFDGTALTIGGYLRDLRAYVRLVDELGEPRTPRPSWATPRPPTDGADHGAAELADEVRRAAGLAEQPIGSVWELCERLGVVPSTVPDEELPQYIDGMSWHTPAALVVHRIGARLRARATACHELCHVLFDQPGLSISAAKGPTSMLYRARVQLEQRANAFAAYLLVPPAGIEALRNGAPDAGLVCEVARTFKVGLHLAANVITNTYHLSEVQRADLIRWAVEAHRPEPPAVAPPPPSPRSLLLRAVSSALSRGHIGEVRARAILGWPLSRPLPFGNHPPVLTDHARVRLAAVRHLESLNRTDLAVERIELHPSGYRVHLTDAWPLQRRRAPGPASLHVGRDFVVSDQ